MSWLSELFHGGKNPANAAKPYLDQIPGVGHGAYDPYIQQGKDATGMLSEQFKRMMSDPQGFLAEIQSGYKPSDAYKFKSGELQKGMGAAAAAGGLAGTGYHQQQYGEQADQLLSGDMQQYLNNVLGINKSGTEGEQGFADKGFESSKALADLLGGGLDQQAGLAFKGQDSQNANKQALFSALAKLLGQGAGGGIGFAVGGLPGAAAGMGITNKLWG